MKEVKKPEYELTHKQLNRRNYDLKVIVNLRDRLRNDQEFLDLTFIERAILIHSLRKLKRQFFKEDFRNIDSQLEKEFKWLKKDFYSKEIEKRGK